MKRKLMTTTIVAAILAVSLAGCGNNGTDSSINDVPVKNDTGAGAVSSGSATNTAVADEDEVLKQVEVKAVPAQGEDGIVCVFVTNNSNTTIDELEVQINYKDESGATIDMDSDGHDMILPGSTVVSRMDAPDTYADCETEAKIELGAHPNYVNHAADVEVNANQGEDCVIVEIQNNSDVTIEEIEYVVVFYKNGQLATVEFPEDVCDVSPGDKVTEKAIAYGTEYDSFEVYLNQAHTF